MACIQGPAIVVPQLPAGVTIPVLSTPPIPVNLALCCQIVNFTIPAINVALPIAFPPPVISALNGYLTALGAFFDSLTVDCPLD